MCAVDRSQDLTSTEKKFLTLEKGDRGADSSSSSPRSEQGPAECGAMPDGAMTTPALNATRASEGLLLRKLVEATDAPVAGGNRHGAKRMAMSDDEIVANARGWVFCSLRRRAVPHTPMPAVTTLREIIDLAEYSALLRL